MRVRDIPNPGTILKPGMLVGGYHFRAENRSYGVIASVDARAGTLLITWDNDTESLHNMVPNEKGDDMRTFTLEIVTRDDFDTALDERRRYLETVVENARLSLKYAESSLNRHTASTDKLRTLLSEMSA